jgi:hypothetical protein
MTYTPTITYTPTLTTTFTPTGSATLSPTPTGSATATLTPNTPNSSLLISVVPYPNPATGNQITFNYLLGQTADTVSFKIFTVAFRKVATFSGTTQAGTNNVPFDVSSFANGLYYYVIVASSGGKSDRKVGKLLVIR